MFNQESMVVKSFVREIEHGRLELNQVPDMFNLIEEVTKMLENRDYDFS